MCGIAGVVGLREPEQILRRMVKQIHHRGPDDKGVYSEEELSIGMTRLAILDLSPLGHQPMQSHCGRYWIVYNGECYNFKEIRLKLEACGDRFRSTSDTEVVLQAYVRWGVDCLNEMNGMFAFAIWDTQDRKLFAARDRLGIKPFYYTCTGSGFVFASEIKTILVSGLTDFILDHEAIVQFFTFGYVQQPRTIVESIKALGPGDYLIFEKGVCKIKSYWKNENRIKARLSFHDAKATLIEKITAAVRRQMISDRPLGVFLSGGLDSATVLMALASSQANSHTFSLSFDANPYAKSEENEAKELSKHFGSLHEQITLDNQSVLNDIPHFFNSLDQPSIDGLNTYLVSKYASRSMTVALSGLGGDELFAGYSRHSILRWKSIHKSTEWLSRMIPLRAIMMLHGKLGDLLWRAKAFGESTNTILNYTFARTLEPPGNIAEYFSKDFAGQININESYQNVFSEFNGNFEKGSLNEILNLDLYCFMSSMLLRDMDSTSMAHSLEVRFPLIDDELIQFAFSLPEEYKLKPISNGRPKGEGTQSYKESGSKRILMEAMEKFLPKGFGDRAKNGFKLPIEYWLKQYSRSQLNELILDESSCWADYLQKEKIQKVISNFLTVNEGGQQLWKILSFVRVLESLKEASECSQQTKVSFD
jgi:asparagine synthase (glutamine-hydrolysing)